MNTKDKRRRGLTRAGLSLLALVVVLTVSLLAGWLPVGGRVHAAKSMSGANFSFSSAAQTTDALDSTSGVIGATEFIGPFPSWANVMDYQAVGDGQADDTAALQRALDDLGTQGHSSVLYLPAGTYRVTNTLKLYGRSGVSIIGEDPATTIVRWDGAAGGTIFDAMGVAYSKWSRITWDGAGKADVAMYNWWDGSSNYFPTNNEHSDEVFQDVNYGIRAGKGNGGDAETTVERAHFLRCAVAGVSIEDWNALDWFIHDSLFEDNGMGVTNTNRAGNFMVDHSVFRRSTVADLAIGNTSYFSFRYNYSVGSKHFFIAEGPTGARANLTLQGNVIVDSTDIPIQSSNPGPLFLIDNIIRTTVTPQMQLGGLAPGMVLSLGNTFTSATPYAIDTQYNALREIGNQIVDGSTLDLPEPALPGTAPNLHRAIFEVPAGSDGSGIQQQIDQAVASGQDEPVVHVPAGNYSVTQTLTIPANTNVRLIGDGPNNTSLRWAGASGSSVLYLQGPSHAILQDFSVGGQDTATGILIDNADQSGGQVFGDQVNMNNMRQNTMGSLLADGLDQTVVQLRNFYHNDNALSDSVKVVGGPQAAAGTPGSGYVGIFDGASSNNKNSYNVQNGGNLLAQDIWYESGNSGFLSLNGSGTFTLQGANIAPATPAGSATIDINNFNGQVSLLSADIDGVTQVEGDGTNTNVLFAGDSFTQADNYLSVQSSQARVGLYANSANRSDEVVPDQNIDDDYLTAMLAQTRTQQLQALSVPSQDITSVQLYRVSVSNAACGIHIQAGSSN